ncbi:MAG: hypothetical protein HY815_12655 [Candidatus Riflebacteria bacterium]|nr:hypothetical protein [Candidatus Riflebacteria bacterium]
MIRSSLLFIALLSGLVACGAWADIAPLPPDHYPPPSPPVVNPYASDLASATRALQQATWRYWMAYYTNPWDYWTLSNAYWAYVDAYNRYTWAYWRWKRASYLYPGQAVTPGAGAPSGTGTSTAPGATGPGSAGTTGGTATQGETPAGRTGATGTPVPDSNSNRNLNDPFN